ncbi:hypothetical protein S40293_00917 [Stachybotrys chartarum IBT 40293]|nr:hypothetical protein S40293_00917 [Stachybotrys chartarum IBT 40293]
MRIARGLGASIVTLLGASLSQAQYLINEQSFGYSGRLSPPEGNGKIPHFVVLGNPQPPEILSNKIILTPVAPGNQRGSVWAENPLKITSWIADVDFRASGPERGGGNLNIWLARAGHHAIGASSIYTVGRFEGLALVIDQHGGSGGMIRGFLNDGSVDYLQHHNIDELAFGHCLYSYRNLGRPSQIKMRQTDTTFKVEIDGRLCFESDKIKIPAGYEFGVSAGTPDTPDSFEIFKLVVMADSLQPQGDTNSNAGNQQQVTKEQEPSKKKSKDNTRDTSKKSNMFEDEDFEDLITADEDADIFQTSKTQFQDLHNRLQTTNHQLSAVYRMVNKHNQLDDQRYNEIKQLLKGLMTEVKEGLGQLQQVSELQKKMKDLEREFRSMRAEVSNKIQANERSVKGYLTDHHATLSQTIIDGMPRHTKLVLLFVGLQLLLAGGYVLYKRRLATTPKKYL